jgi:hypothetical protein
MEGTMNRSINCLMLLAAVAVVTPACVDDTTDSLPTAPGLRPDKPGTEASTLPSGLHAQLIAQLAQLAGIEVRPDASIRRSQVEQPTEWSETIAAPELCADCELTVIHLDTLDLWSVQVYRDDGEMLCAMSRSSRGIVRDTCSHTL